MKNSTISTLPFDSKMSKKEMFESVFTTVFAKANGTLGRGGGGPLFKIDDIEANESQPVMPMGLTKTKVKEAPKVKFVEEEMKETKAEVVEVPDDPREKEIERKVNEYNRKLVSENLLKVLTEEREKEEEREQLFYKTKDPIEKKRLEKILAFERAQSSERINKINEEINEKLQLFEKKLKSSQKKI
jgi:hypothetical protein